MKQELALSRNGKIHIFELPKKCDNIYDAFELVHNKMYDKEFLELVTDNYTTLDAYTVDVHLVGHNTPAHISSIPLIAYGVQKAKRWARRPKHSIKQTRLFRLGSSA